MFVYKGEEQEEEELGQEEVQRREMSRKNGVANRTTAPGREPTGGRIRPTRRGKGVRTLRRTSGVLPFHRGDRVGGGS